MAVNRSDHLTPGLSGLIARIEMLLEPGKPRNYWDGTANAWAPTVAPQAGAAPALGPHVAVIPDPDLPGLYLTQVASGFTKDWPDGLYRYTLLNPALSGDQVAREPVDFWMVLGDDGSALGYPSAMLPWLGGVLWLGGSRLLTPTLPPAPAR